MRAVITLFYTRLSSFPSGILYRQLVVFLRHGLIIKNAKFTAVSGFSFLFLL